MNVPLRIAICEDQVEDASYLLNIIKKGHLPISCNIFTSGDDLLENFYLARYDIIFLDIYMPEMEGIEVANMIREQDNTVVLAFTTTSTDHTLESYRLGALKYLEKPVKAKEVYEILDLAYLKKIHVPSISILIGGKLEYIPTDTILYFEHQNHKVLIHTLWETLYTSQTVKISSIETKLPCPPFLRCHHSFIVNLKHVAKLDKDLRVFIMANGGTVHIRRQDIKQATKAYEDELFNMTRGGS